MFEIYNRPKFLKSRIVVDFFLVGLKSIWVLKIEIFEIYNYHRCLKSIIVVDDFSEV